MEFTKHNMGNVPVIICFDAIYLKKKQKQIFMSNILYINRLS